MNFSQKKPCRECPFLANVKGWIGDHDSAKEFHDLVANDIRMPCHLTNNNKQQHCAGYAMYMNKMCKLSTDKNMAELQEKVRKIQPPKELLFSFDGQKLVNFHGQ